MATISEFINKVGFKVKNEDVKKVNNSISDIKDTAMKLLGAIGIGFSLTSINGLVEEFTRVKDQIRNSTSGLGDNAEIQQKILDAATATRSEYSETAKMVSNLVKENSKLFGNVDEAIKFNNAATMLFKSAGKTNGDIAGLMEAINKSFAKGYVDSETLSQLLERSPEAVELLNKQLGTTSDQLEQLAADGKFTVEDLKAAFVNNADDIAASFGNVQMTITDALTVIRNKWGLWLADSNEMLGITNAIAKGAVKGFDAIMRVLTKVRNGVVWVTQKLGGTENVMRLIAIAATAIGAISIIKNLGKIGSFLGTIGTKLSFINAQNLKLLAGVLILALLVDDFINFMQGNDSLIGALFEKLGIDADAARQTIIDAWNAVVDFFDGVGEKISNVYDSVKSSVGGFIDKVKDGVDWLREHETVLGLVAIAVGTLTAAIIAYNVAQAIKNAGGIAELAQLALLQVQLWGLTVAQGAHTAASWVAAAATTAFGAAMAFLTSPVTLTILAIGALIAIIFLLVKNWDKIKEVAAACWDRIVEIFSGVADWFSGVFSAAWEAIKGVFSAVGEFFRGVWDTIVGIFTTVGTAIGDAISGAVKGAINKVLSGAANIINGFIKAINFAIGIINKIPGVSIKQLKTLEVPQLAEGGYVKPNRPLPVIIGDNKTEGEIVSPISKMRDTMLDALGMFMASAKVSAPTAAVASGGSNVSKNIIQSVEINNEFNGDRAIQKKAATAMDKAATDVTAALARGLAYAR